MLRPMWFTWLVPLLTYVQLVAMLDGDRDPLRRECAARLLGHRHLASAAPALSAHLDRDGDPWVRAQAAESLGLLGAGRDALGRALDRERDEQVRLSVALALVRLGDQRGGMALLRLLRHGTNHTRAHAMQALVDLSGEPLGEDAGAWEKWLASRTAVARPPAMVDLTHRLAAGIPTFGGEAGFSLRRVADYRQGYYANVFSTGEHVGTHVDAPAHFAPGTATVEWIAPGALRAPAVVLDVRASVARDPDYAVDVGDLVAWEREHGRIPDGALIVARTGWEERWDDAARYRDADARGVLHFPGFSSAAAEWLLAQRPNFVGLGIDTLSVDAGRAVDFPVHRRTHAAGKYHVENLANLAALPAQGATLTVAPLPIAAGSGAPARVFAETP
jgi:kynurenine formamidase